MGVAKPPIQPPMGDPIVPGYLAGWQQGEEASERLDRIIDLVDRIVAFGRTVSSKHDLCIGIANLLDPAIELEIDHSWAAWGWQPAETSSSQ